MEELLPFTKYSTRLNSLVVSFVGTKVSCGKVVMGKEKVEFSETFSSSIIFSPTVGRPSLRSTESIPHDKIS